MPTLVVDDVPLDVYEGLQRRAEAGRRSIPEEALALLKKGLSEEPVPPRRPDFLATAEVAAPFDLPRPEPVGYVPAVPGGSRLPDPPA
jgi:hypothetical protein